MLEKVDLNKSVDKENYKKLREEMDVKLGELQRACKAEKIPVVIVFDGFGAGGKGTQINRLIQPLDPRGFDVYASRETDASIFMAVLDEDTGRWTNDDL